MQFTTGLELFQAMIGGSLDMLSTGAVVSNFPARGQGKVFLLNNVEFATAQLWVREDQGIKSFADLKGKKISTTTGTTAHVFLDNALRANKLDPAKDVRDRQPAHGRGGDLVRLRRGAGGRALGAVRRRRCKQKVPGAKKLVDASAYYPKAAIVGGWAARNDFYDEEPARRCARSSRGWAEANDCMIAQLRRGRSRRCRRSTTRKCRSPTFKEQFKALEVLHLGRVAQAVRRRHGHRWLQQVTDFFVALGNIQNPVPASKYFDPKLYLETVKG